MSHYQYHVFFCVNQRTDGRDCCQGFDSQAMRDYMKSQVKKLGLNKPNGVRINTAGCLDRCELGPVMVVYPQGIWYTYVDNSDLDEIIESHLLNGIPVHRLMLTNTGAKNT